MDVPGVDSMLELSLYSPPQTSRMMGVERGSFDTRDWAFPYLHTAVDLEFQLHATPSRAYYDTTTKIKQEVLITLASLVSPAGGFSAQVVAAIASVDPHMMGVKCGSFDTRDWAFPYLHTAVDLEFQLHAIPSRAYDDTTTKIKQEVLITLASLVSPAGGFSAQVVAAIASVDPHMMGVKCGSFDTRDWAFPYLHTAVDLEFQLHAIPSRAYDDTTTKIKQEVLITLASLVSPAGGFSAQVVAAIASVDPHMMGVKCGSFDTRDWAFPYLHTAVDLEFQLHAIPSRAYDDTTTKIKQEVLITLASLVSPAGGFSAQVVAAIASVDPHMMGVKCGSFDTRDITTKIKQEVLITLASLVSPAGGFSAQVVAAIASVDPHMMGVKCGSFDTRRYLLCPPVLSLLQFQLHDVPASPSRARHPSPAIILHRSGYPRQTSSNLTVS
ncbi:hypothetical protein EDD15DRAFT_2370605 [Pisolithus albus]|nr:hypothetical protein EDD15DRAFT_2370605 [Pisolithus albus]